MPYHCNLTSGHSFYERMLLVNGQLTRVEECRWCGFVSQGYVITANDSTSTIGSWVRAVALAVIIAAPVVAQVRIAAAPSPPSFSRSIFDHRTAKYVQHWSVVVTNDGLEPITVSEAEVQGWMIRNGATAVASNLVRIGSEEIKRRGKWQTVGRVAVDAAFLATALAAGDVIDLTAREGALLGFGALTLPKFGERVASRDPDVHNFDAVALAEPFSVGPGESVAVSMFAVRNDKAGPMNGLLRDVGPMPLMPSALPEIERYPAPALWASVRQGRQALSVDAGHGDLGVGEVAREDLYRISATITVAGMAR